VKVSIKAKLILSNLVLRKNLQFSLIVSFVFPDYFEKYREQGAFTYVTPPPLLQLPSRYNYLPKDTLKVENPSNFSTEEKVFSLFTDTNKEKKTHHCKIITLDIVSVRTQNRKTSLNSIN